MNITIRNPLGYTHIGKKDQQEDAVWPPFDQVTPANRCFVLCDGVGGSAHGEIASQTASKVIGQYLTAELNRRGIVSSSDVHQAVNLAYDELERIDTEGFVDGKPSMATTLTCVCIHDEGILAAHMGDSRIYLVRPGQGLLYQSSDHSLVNALLKAGEITLEEAMNFPRKNVITKAIQPHADKRFDAEVHQLTDVQSGDYIFMCCDGVLEKLSNERLVEILSLDASDNSKLALLEAESLDRTKDNFTAYLIPIDKVEGVSAIQHDDVEATEVVVPMRQNLDPQPREVTPPQPVPEGRASGFGAMKLAACVIALALIAASVFFVKQHYADWFNSDGEPSATQSEQTKTQAPDKDDSNVPPTTVQPDAMTQDNDPADGTSDEGATVGEDKATVSTAKENVPAVKKEKTAATDADTSGTQGTNQGSPEE